MPFVTSQSFDPEVLEFWCRQANWQSVAFNAFAKFLG